MGVVLEDVVPWGRGFAEYAAMFALDDGDLQKQILGCGDGPAAFNAELSRRGGCVVSLDPIYAFSAADIRVRIAETFAVIMTQMQGARNQYVWRHIRSVEELGQVRLAAMNDFLDDFPQGLPTGRYMVGSLPTLPFPDQHFALALCSHLLFLYSAQLDQAFHLSAMRELLRVAAEVRVFPLLTLAGVESPHLPEVLRVLTQAGFACERVRVDYEFQRGGNEMLRITHPARPGD